MKVFISAPYTNGDVAKNVNRVLKVADELLDLGFDVYVPHLSHFWHIISPKPYNTWLKLDLAFLRCCDYVLRLDGESDGADNEVKLAKILGIPVYYNVKDFKEAQNENTSNRLSA